VLLGAVVPALDPLVVPEPVLEWLDELQPASAITAAVPTASAVRRP
jgi:hypothetical protein